MKNLQNLQLLKNEINAKPEGLRASDYYRWLGYREHLNEPVPIARAYAAASLFTNHKKHIYHNDLVAGSVRGLIRGDLNRNDLEQAERYAKSFGLPGFLNNVDHFAADYEKILRIGICGIREDISSSLSAHINDADYEKKKIFLTACDISICAFGEMIRQYGEQAKKLFYESADTQRANLNKIASMCNHLSTYPPRTFHEALQLVWLVHTAFLYEGRYAMAFGRLDQYLYPFYERDIDNGVLTRGRAVELIENTLIKIGESRFFGGDDVVNIAIAGLKRDGSGGLNGLSYAVLEAVRNCNIPGPNLSARLYDGVPDEFLDECLKVIGTGLGYPALMNDMVNIPALQRHGYSLEDCRDYCFVGCIENFIQGKQPPWSDGRYNAPKFVELALNNGVCMQTGAQMGPETGDCAGFSTMESFIGAFKKQAEFGAAEYAAMFNNENDRYNRVMYTQPFLSCFCQDCIGRGLDVNDGGAAYPSVHGAGCMGIATVADSFAAIEKLVYVDGQVGLPGFRDALLADYENYEGLRALAMNAPKYGNNDDFVDKYAIWYVEYLFGLFSTYRTRDGGSFYTAIASNVQNVAAGLLVAATPDGRRNKAPLSDAASPTYGMDRNGPTAALNSLSKCDYSLVSCGTVVNQKYSPSAFTNPATRAKLLALIKTYFQNGGQELQINCISKDVLEDAMVNPERYAGLVVRVSGFSAYYTNLDPAVQRDILSRTEHFSY